MKALITGDRGFLGRHFTAELKRRGWEVQGLDVKTTASQDCRNHFRWCLEHPVAAGKGQWDLVIHCAAVVGGRATIENDPLATAESLSIDAEMFRWAAVTRPGRVLYISSSAAYPVTMQTGPEYGPLHEAQVWEHHDGGVLEPDEVYGWSKVTGELLADRLRKTGVPVTVVRPFSGYGADQNHGYPFRDILERVLELQPDRPLELWCGDCTRDWIHVDDLVRGALAVADSGTEDPVNLCTGVATSFVSLAQQMLLTAGKGDHGILADPEAPQGVAYRVGDPARMLRYYIPQISLAEGIKRALAQ